VFSYQQLITLAITSILPGLESQTTEMPINAIFCTTFKCEQPWGSQKDSRNVATSQSVDQMWSLLTNFYGFFSF
jgi:hypothetical protein